MSTILLIACIPFAIFYLLLMRYFIQGWKKLENEELPKIKPRPRTAFSVIITARNEEGNIAGCLQSIIAQRYPPELLEIIVADDHSTDTTAAIVEDMINDNPALAIKLIRMEHEPQEVYGQAYKKRAITAAVKAARHPWVITTDADCSRGQDWLRAIDAYILAHQPYLISAPVIMQPGKGFFQQAQALEFTALIGIGGASIALGSPNMCNGANLIYRKDIFLQLGAYKGDAMASGDDEFLMHRIFEKYPQKVKFLKSEHAFVFTKPVDTLPDFIDQRRRWVSKSRKYERGNITTVLAAAFIFHLLLFISILGSFFSFSFFIPLALLLVAKMAGEYIFLQRVCKWAGQEDLLRIYRFAALLYIVYVLFIGIYGNFGTYNWKGRRIA